ncbi:hypothetical protein K1719_047230, partial [Acacia pycnantha]
MASNGQNGYVLTLLLLILTFWSYGAVSRKVQESSSSLERHEQWMAKYGKVYDDVAEKQKRFEIFKNNVQFIESFNSNGTKPYKLSVNQFADQTNEEFKATHNGLKKKPHGSPRLTMSSSSSVMEETPSPFRYENVTTLPAFVDWRHKGAVTPVKNQGQCGSCWAFGVIAATEGAHKLTNGKLVSLSEQELVDCYIFEGEDQGCVGGYMEDGFEFIKKIGGITTEENYPYTGTHDKCNTYKVASSHVAQIKGYEKVPVNSELALQKAVANQPVSVTIDADSFQFYSSGVFTEGCELVGTDWGEEGYMRMLRNVDAKEGLCGITMDAGFPIAMKDFNSLCPSH